MAVFGPPSPGSTAGVPFWTDQLANPDPKSFTNPPDVWSLVYMGSSQLQLLPGLLENGDISWKKHPHRVIDPGKKPATDGATPKLLGVGVSHFDLKMVIHARQQLESLSQLLPNIWPNKSTPGQAGIFGNNSVAAGNGIPGATTTFGLNLTQVTASGGPTYIQSDGPLFISNPALALANITQVIVEGWTPPIRWQGKNDVKMYVIHCIEYRHAVKTKAVTPQQTVKPPKLAGQILVNGQPETATPSTTGAGPLPVLG